MKLRHPDPRPQKPASSVLLMPPGRCLGSRRLLITAKNLSPPTNGPRCSDKDGLLSLPYTTGLPPSLLTEPISEVSSWFWKDFGSEAENVPPTAIHESTLRWNQ